MTGPDVHFDLHRRLRLLPSGMHQLLETFGTSVVLEDADGWGGVLKYRVDEIRGTWRRHANIF